MAKVSVLITDDSLTMRSIIKSVLRQDSGIEVIGEAVDAFDAREKIKSLNPDVLLLDIHMPMMSGLKFLKNIMNLRPMPVVMLSGTTQKGARESIEALSLGAFDCLEKPSSGDYISGLSALPSIIKAAANSKLAQKHVGNANTGANGSDSVREEVGKFQADRSIIGIGSSTGGVEALYSILSQFPENCPPTVITQHMPSDFLASFARRLDRTVAPCVKIASEGDVLENGHVYFAPGGDKHLVIRGRTKFNCHLDTSGPVSGHTPSVDVMFSSMARSVGKRGVGVILTGLGKDGAKGLLSMRQTGARTMGQNAKTCIVYGMPKVAKEIGATEKEYAISNIGHAIISMCNRNKESAA